MSVEVFTIGHSNHTAEALLGLLALHRITALADVRSLPYSRYNPQFDREALSVTLKQANILYVYLGNQLGARSADPTCYRKGQVQFDRLARTPHFQQGLNRVRTGAATHRIALMCAEKEPLECHRTILVSRHLVESGVVVTHIHADAHLESHDEALTRLCALLHLRAEEHHLFRTHQNLIEDAYTLQAKRIAFQVDPDAPEA